MTVKEMRGLLYDLAKSDGGENQRVIVRVKNSSSGSFDVESIRGKYDNSILEIELKEN